MMGEVNWGLGLMQSNPGEAFMNAYKQGIEQKRQGQTRQAMARLVTNPDDAEALQMLAEGDPQAAMQFQGQRKQQAMQAAEQHRDAIMAGAKIFRQLGVRDEPSYQQALQVARQYGLPLDQVPPSYNPEYVNGVISLADAFDKPNEGTTLQRDYEFLKGQNPDLAEQYLRNKAEGSPIVANNGDGTFTIVPRNMVGQGGPQPGAVEDGYRFKGGNPADPNAWEPMNGGQTPQASGTFQP